MNVVMGGNMNLDELVKHLEVLSKVGRDVGQSDDEVRAWVEGYISALADYHIMTEDDVDRLISIFCPRIQ